MKTKIITGIIAAAFAMPAFGAVDIPATGNSTCDSSTLKSSSGNVALEADWSANNISITWDGNGGSTPTNGAASCTYDSTFTLPTKPSRTGYTFAGWTVQTAQQCSLSGLNANTNGIDYLSRSLDNSWCYYYNDDTGDENDDCNDSMFSGLSTGEWQANFSYGSIKGIAKCSSTDGTYAQAGTPSDTNGQYCWCQATSYTANGASACSVSSPAWVFDADDVGAGYCAFNCAHYCASYVRDNSDFRRTLFGI